ncbi:MAG TPA: proline--tRNA ligase [Clostridiales bacterium]|nr:proline--tRNA ligase [Clostridiales bacterium]
MADKDFVKEIADIESDFAQWYTDVILKTNLVDYGPVKGTMIMRPYGYAIWEFIQSGLDKRIKETGHQNAYFPLFIPESFLQKEAEHVEGFAPEVARVTHIGQEPLAEALVVRPTSETIICHMYSRWIQSYRDLPVLINQWANIVRWEKTTRPFLRTSEFLWQEGHTVHATEEEAKEETLKMLEVYQLFLKEELAIPVLAGKKSQKEKFAGAQETYSIEAMMLDGKSLQAGTSHYLGQNFSKAFNIRFLDRDGTHKFAYQTSWGVTTRLIGALIMVHGDKRGLVLPPKVAPTQAIIIPIASKKPEVLKKCEEVLGLLKSLGIRAEIDQTDASPGWKFNEYEMKGVPIRIEIGPRDIQNGVATVSRRDTLTKTELKLDTIAQDIQVLLDAIQIDMYEKANNFLNSHITTVNNLKELEAAIQNNHFALSMWCGQSACEDLVKEKFQATSRNMPFDQTPCGDACAICGKEPKYKIYWGKAY